MRKIIVSGVAVIGLLAVALTVMGHPVSFKQAGAEGSGADVRVTRHNLVAQLDAGRSGRPLLVADDGGNDSRPDTEA